MFCRGDPDKANFDGATAVHLAANCGQLNCLSFLTNFGCNIWALNNDGRTPLEDAAYHGRMDCVRHLDGLIAIEMMRDKKAAERQKLQSKREAIKRVKKQSKRQQERDKAYDRRVKNELKDRYDTLGTGPKSEDTNGNTLRKRSTGSMYKDRPFSEQVAANGISKSTENIEANNHKYSDTFSQRSQLFQRLKGKINSTLRGKKSKDDDDFFKKRSSLSQPNLFDGGGTIASRNSSNWRQTPSMRSTGSLASGSDSSDDENVPEIGHIIKTYDNSGNISTQIHYNDSASNKPTNGTVSSRKRAGSSSSSKSARSHDVLSLRSAGYDEQDISTYNEMADTNEMKAVITFLSCLKLEQFARPFIQESLDLSALVLCSDKDLQELGLPLGPRRKILEAARKHQMAIQSPATMADTKI